MRGFVPDYDMISAENLKEALQLLNQKPGYYKPMAGGTDLMVLFEAGKLKHKNFLNILGLQELKYIRVSEQEVHIGALTTYKDLQNHPVIREEFPLLIEGARLTGASAIQHRGTIGGNVANASPAADSPPGFYVYRAKIKMVSVRGERIVDYNEFHTGYKTHLLEDDELIQEIILIRTHEFTHQFYRKVGTRKAQAISKACVAIGARYQGKVLEDIRIGLGSIGPCPYQAQKTEKVLHGKVLTPEVIDQAIQTLHSEIRPIDDVRSTGEYRLQVVSNILKDFLNGLTQSGR